MKSCLSFSVRAVRDVSGHEERELKSEGSVRDVEGRFSRTTRPQVKITCGPSLEPT